MEKWYNKSKQFLEVNDIVGVLVGNKCDLEQRVKDEVAEKFGAQHTLVNII